MRKQQNLPLSVSLHYDELVRETSQARLFNIGGVEVWFPKSNTQDYSPKNHTIEVPEWLAHSRGIQL